MVTLLNSINCRFVDYNIENLDTILFGWNTAGIPLGFLLEISPNFQEKFQQYFDRFAVPFFLKSAGIVLVSSLVSPAEFQWYSVRFPEEFRRNAFAILLGFHREICPIKFNKMMMSSV